MNIDWVAFAGLAVVVIGALIKFLIAQKTHETKTEMVLTHINGALAAISTSVETAKNESRKRDSDIMRELHKRDERLDGHDERLRQVEQRVAVHEGHCDHDVVKLPRRGETA